MSSVSCKWFGSWGIATGKAETGNVKSKLGGQSESKPAPFGESKPKGMRHPGAPQRVKGAPPASTKLSYSPKISKKWKRSCPWLPSSSPRLGDVGVFSVFSIIVLLIGESLSNALKGRDAEKLHLLATEQVPRDH